MRINLDILTEILRTLRVNDLKYYISVKYEDGSINAWPHRNVQNI